MVPRISKRPFLLECIGLGSLLVGTLTMMEGLGLVLFRIFPLAVARAAAGASRPEILGLLAEAVSCIAIAYAVLKDRAWGQHAILAVSAGNLAVRAGATSPSAFLSILVGLTFPVWYLYFWPNTIDYYRSLRERKDSGDPMDGLSVQPKEI
jgi:hypothetical protein